MLDCGAKRQIATADASSRMGKLPSKLEGSIVKSITLTQDAHNSRKIRSVLDVARLDTRRSAVSFDLLQKNQHI